MRRAATALIALVTLLASTSGAFAADPRPVTEGDAARRARAAPADLLGRPPEGVRSIATSDAMAAVGGRRFWTGVFADVAGDRQAFVAVDLATGTTMDATAYQRLVETAESELPRITPPAQARIDAVRAGRAPGRSGAESAAAAALPVTAIDRSRGPLLAYVLGSVDYEPAVRAVKAAHPEVEWDGDRPVGEDLDTLGRVSHELIRAKVALLARAREPFVEYAKARGATDLVTLDLAPMVYLRVPVDRVDALAAHESVRQVRAPATWEPTMNVAHTAVGANWTDGRGFTGAGVVIGVVEYTRVDYSRPGLAGTRLDSYRVSSTGLSCPNSRGQYANASAITHVSWAAAIAAGRGSTYKGIANGARIVDVSADFDPKSDAADPRILKAVDCAIVEGGAHLITMSLVQNDASTYATSNAYFDAVVWDHHRLIVGNGGNNYAESNSHCPGSTERVQSPGSAWNVLTVGGTSNDASRLWYRSGGSEPSFCWEDPPGHPGDANDRVKPEIAAPAQSVSSGFANGSGVSASTPIVAGIAAQLIDQEPGLLNYPERLKAILLAGSEAKHALTPSGYQNSGVEGLGTASAKWASRIVERDSALDTGSYGGLTFRGDDDGSCFESPPSQTIDFDVPYASRTVRFVIDWMAHAGPADPRAGLSSRRWADFNLMIRKGGTYVRSSTRSASNVEWVDFNGSMYGPGRYTAVITPVRWGCDVATEPVAWAWVSFTTP